MPSHSHLITSHQICDSATIMDNQLKMKLSMRSCLALLSRNEKAKTKRDTYCINMYVTVASGADHVFKANIELAMQKQITAPKCLLMSVESFGESCAEPPPPPTTPVCGSRSS